MTSNFKSKIINTLPSSVKSLAQKTLAQKRKGGRANITGIEYQLQYAIYKALTVLSSDSTDRQIRLEGIEDIDLINNKIEVDNQELYQLKHTSEPLSASRVWQFGILQNFAEAYLLNEQITFVIVTNQPVKNAELISLFEGNIDNQTYQYIVLP